MNDEPPVDEWPSQHIKEPFESVASSRLLVRSYFVFVLFVFFCSLTFRSLSFLAFHTFPSASFSVAVGLFLVLVLFPLCGPRSSGRKEIALVAIETKRQP